MGILSWIIFGLIAGILAKWIMPGKDGGGFIVTVILGIIGAVVGGWISTLFGFGKIGVLYARSELLQTMAPWEGGGSMIATVSLTEGTTWNQAPWRFEAGTPNTGGIIGLGAALTYVSQLGLTQIAEYEQTLMRYALDALRAVPDLILYGPAQRKGVIAFNLGQHHAYDVGSFLDNYGIAVRTGHHCAMPLMARYQVPAMCRASLAMYNTTEEVDRLVAGLQRIRKLLG